MTVDINGLSFYIQTLLDEIQLHMYNRAKKEYRDDHITKVDSWNEFIHVLDEKPVLCQHTGTAQQQLKKKIKELTKTTYPVHSAR